MGHSRRSQINLWRLHDAFVQKLVDSKRSWARKPFCFTICYMQYLFKYLDASLVYASKLSFSKSLKLQAGELQLQQPLDSLHIFFCDMF